MAYKHFSVDDKFSRTIVLYKGENTAYKFIEKVIEEHEYCKILMKNISTKIWVWLKKTNNFNQVIRAGYVKNSLKMKKSEIIVTWGTTYWRCNINLQLTKKVSVIFHKLRGYDSHLIFDDLKKFDVKTDVIPNRLEKCMVFILNKSLVLIEAMQFMNSSPEKLVKNLADNDFKYLTQ